MRSLLLLARLRLKRTCSSLSLCSDSLDVAPQSTHQQFLPTRSTPFLRSPSTSHLVLSPKNETKLETRIPCQFPRLSGRAILFLLSLQLSSLSRFLLSTQVPSQLSCEGKSLKAIARLCYSEENSSSSSCGAVSLEHS